MSRWTLARTVVEEHAVSTEIDRATKHFERVEEAWEAAKWLLARKCDSLSSLSKSADDTMYTLYRIAGDSLAGTPDITVLYTFDDDEVCVLGVRIEKADDASD